MIEFRRVAGMRLVVCLLLWSNRNSLTLRLLSVIMLYLYMYRKPSVSGGNRSRKAIMSSSFAPLFRDIKYRSPSEVTDEEIDILSLVSFTLIESTFPYVTTSSSHWAALDSELIIKKNCCIPFHCLLQVFWMIVIEHSST